MKNEPGVSSVVGVVLLLLLVIVASSIMAVVLSTATNEAVDSTPNALFTISNNNQTLYHGGGDVLYKNRLVFYNNGAVISNGIEIDSVDTWTEWHTGQAIKLPTGNHVENLTIIALDSLGRQQLLYRGSAVVSKPLPTYTGTRPTIPLPTVTSPPTPTPTPTPTYLPNADFTWELVFDPTLPSILPSSLNANAIYAIIDDHQVPEGWLGWPITVRSADIKFTAVQTGDVTYSWSCTGADNPSPNIKSPKMRFSDPDSYSVTLTVTNSSGSNSSTKTVFIRKPSLTVMTWVKSNNKNNIDWFARDAGGAGVVYKWRLSVSNSGYTFEVGQGIYSGVTVNSNVGVEDKNIWYHVTGTFDFNNPPNNAIIYYNGTAKKSETASHSLTSGVITSTSWGNSPKFICDDWYKIPFVLTPFEVELVYNAEKSVHA